MRVENTRVLVRRQIMFLLSFIAVLKMLDVVRWFVLP